MCVMLFDELGHESLEQADQNKIGFPNLLGYDGTASPSVLRWFDSLTRVILGRHNSKTAGLFRLAESIIPNFDKVMG